MYTNVWPCSVFGNGFLCHVTRWKCVEIEQKCYKTLPRNSHYKKGSALLCLWMSLPSQTMQHCSGDETEDKTASRVSSSLIHMTSARLVEMEYITVQSHSTDRCFIKKHLKMYGSFTWLNTMINKSAWNWLTPWVREVRTSLMTLIITGWRPEVWTLISAGLQCFIQVEVIRSEHTIPAYYLESDSQYCMYSKVCIKKHTRFLLFREMQRFKC